MKNLLQSIDEKIKELSIQINLLDNLIITNRSLFEQYKHNESDHLRIGTSLVIFTETCTRLMKEEANLHVKWRFVFSVIHNKDFVKKH